MSMPFLKEMTISRICIFLFLIFNVGCYFAELSSLVSLSYVFLLGGCFVSLMEKRRFPNIVFVMWILAFLAYSFVSVLWSYSVDLTFQSIIILLKVAITVICFYYMLQSKEDFQFSLGALSLAGVLWGILYLSLLDFDISVLSNNRFYSGNDNFFDMPNLNVVSLYLSFSFVYFSFMFFRTKNVCTLILAIVALFLIVVLGSRKSIISIVICLALIFPKLHKSNKVQLIAFIFISLFLLVSFIPSEYISFVSERLGQLNFLAEEIKLDESDQIRVALFDRGIDYSMDAPILGNGFYVFSQLFNRDCGIAFYSHNNFIETYVGGGLVGFLMYYVMYIYLFLKVYRRSALFDYQYLCFLLLLILIFNHVGIVVLLDRFVWLLLAIIYAGTLYMNNNVSYRKTRHVA